MRKNSLLLLLTRIIYIGALCFLGLGNLWAQSTATPTMGGGGGGMNNMPMMNFGRGGTGAGTQTDSMGNIQSDWDDTPAKIYFQGWNSDLKKNIDTSLAYFHRNARIANWGRNLGNEGSPAYDMIFNPRQDIGFHSGFTAWDFYKLNPDSVKFYNTTRPYSDFGYIMGPKKQQYVKLLHTQNISPNWNVAGEVINLNSPGVYKLQSSRHIVAHVSTNYKSDNERYQLKSVLLYHRFRQDENGGIESDSFLTAPGYNDKGLIPVNFLGRNYSTVNSGVTNTQKEMRYLLKHQYALVGVSDTVYNEDSTSIEVTFTPRFTLNHTLDIRNQQNIFNDVVPDFQRYFDFDGQIYNFNTTDSVYSNQKWFSINNKFGLSTTLGKNENNVRMEVGVGNVIDRFKHSFPQDGNDYKQTLMSNFIYGQIMKEAQQVEQWSYGASGKMYVTGQAAGNFMVDVYAGKVIKDIAMLQAGFRQSLSEPGYFQQQFRNQYFVREASLSPMSVTNIWGQLGIPKWKANISVRNLLLANYIYMDDKFIWQQQSEAFNVLQVAAQKNFRLGIFFNENEAIYQQKTANASINVPALMLRHQIRIETPVFNKNLHFSLGIEGRYHTKYDGNGYSPYLNQFYYQNGYTLNNKPELMAFFNFKVRGFRAFVVFDQLQTMFWDNNIYAKGYASNNTIFRFGFNWVLYN